MVKPMDVTNAIVIDRKVLEDENRQLFVEMHDIITNYKGKDWQFGVTEKLSVYLVYLKLLGIKKKESPQFKIIKKAYKKRIELEGNPMEELSKQDSSA